MTTTLKTGDEVTTKTGITGKVWGFTTRGHVCIQTQPKSNTWQHCYPAYYFEPTHEFVRATDGTWRIKCMKCGKFSHEIATRVINGRITLIGCTE